jgi:hypothetical protein
MPSDTMKITPRTLLFGVDCAAGFFSAQDENTEAAPPKVSALTQLRRSTTEQFDVENIHTS